MYTNQKNYPLPIAIWLANDEYVRSTDSKTISVTTLLKPLKELVLAPRVPEDEKLPIDVSGLISSRLGTAVHDAITKAWKSDPHRLMSYLDIPKGTIGKIVVNGEPEHLPEDSIPVYTEIRTTKSLGDWTVTGEFDLSFNGYPIDFKTTKTFTYVNNTSDEDYIKQLSMYAWLNPDIITSSTGSIIYIFTDFKPYEAKNPNYPNDPIVEKKFNLIPPHQIEGWINNKLGLLEHYYDMDQKELPACTPEELWMQPSTYKYYANPDKLARATKNFDSYLEATIYKNEKGKGIVIEKKGEVRKCKYCSAFPICEQAKSMIADGTLTV
jgi:hypothetical protein